MRYPGQNWPLTIELARQSGIPDFGFLGEDLAHLATAGFNALHQAEFGHIRENEHPEVTGVRLTTTVHTESPPVGSGLEAEKVAAVAKKIRRANLGDGFKDTPIYLGVDLKPGEEVCGPGIIEESFTTIVVYPGWTASVDDAGDYQLLKNP